MGGPKNGQNSIWGETGHLQICPGLHPSGLHPSGLHPSTLLGSTLFGAPPFVIPKFNIQKLAEIEIGRSRNWPKSKLPEVKIGQSRNWPKLNWPNSKKRAGRSRNWLKSIALTWEDASVESQRSQRRVLVGSAWKLSERRVGD